MAQAMDRGAKAGRRLEVRRCRREDREPVGGPAADGA